MAPEDEGTAHPVQPSIDPSRHPAICRNLSRAAADRCDQILRGSNYTFLVALSLDGKLFDYGIYKPRRGENPLWDFPIGTLYKREVAAYLLSEALGWHFIPPTVIWDGPYGEGSLQLFIRTPTRPTTSTSGTPTPRRSSASPSSTSSSTTPIGRAATASRTPAARSGASTTASPSASTPSSAPSSGTSAARRSTVIAWTPWPVNSPASTPPRASPTV